MPTLELSRLWGGGDTPIKFDLWYECSRDPNNGKATYCVYGRIKALTSKQGKFGYPINMEVSIKKSTDTNWSAFNWVKTGTSSCDFKASSPINWDQDIQYNTSNKQIDASPGENVQLKLRIYSNGASAVAGRDITFTYQNLVVPALQTATLVSVADFEIKTSTRLTTVTMRGYNANYTYSLDISYNGVSLISRNSLNVTASGDVYTANIAIGNSERNTIYGKLPNNGSVRATCTLTTKNGNTIIGSSSTQCTCTIPSTVAPAISSITSSLNGTYTPSGSSTPLCIQSETSVQISAVAFSPGSGANPSSNYIVEVAVDKSATEGTSVALENTNKVFWLEKQPNANTITVYKNGSAVEATFTIASSADATTGLWKVTVVSSALSNGDDITVSYTYTITTDYREDTDPTVGSPWVIKLTDFGNTTVRVYVYDTRGRSASRVVNTIFVHPYHPPRIVDYVSTRCEASSPYADDPSGINFKGVVNTDISTLAEYHTVTLANNGLVGIAYVEYDGYQYYDTGDTIQGIPHGATITCHVGDPEGYGATYVTLDGAIVASEPGGPYYSGGVTYQMPVIRDLSIGFDVSVHDTCYLNATSLQPPNDAKIKVDYKKSTSSIWTEGSWITLTGARWESGAIGASNIAADSSYDIRYTIKDAVYIEGISVMDYLSSAEFTIFLSKGGKGVSIGEVYTPTGGDKVLNVSNDWSLSRGGQPAVREDSSGWVIHDLGGGYIEMWGEIDCTVSGWTQWGSSDVYYSSVRFNKDYPYSITFDGAPFVTATVRTYYTNSTNHPNLWLVTDAQSSINTESNQTETTPDYVLARIGTLSSNITAKIAVHVMGKPVVSS